MFLKIWQILQENNYVGAFFLIKLQAFRPATLLKRDSNTGVIMWNLRNFQEHFFYRTPFYSDCFCVFWKSKENYSPEQLTNPILAGNSFTKNFTTDFSENHINSVIVFSQCWRRLQKRHVSYEYGEFYYGEFINHYWK